MGPPPRRKNLRHRARRDRPGDVPRRRPRPRGPRQLHREPRQQVDAALKVSIHPRAVAPISAWTFRVRVFPFLLTHTGPAATCRSRRIILPFATIQGEIANGLQAMVDVETAASPMPAEWSA